jgi:hypothetical protein
MKMRAWSLGVGVCFAIVSLSWSQDQTKTADTLPGPGPVSIKISLDHDEIGTGSPITLTVTMTNITQERHCYSMVRGYGNGIYNFSAKVLKSNGNGVGPSPAIINKNKEVKETISSKRECLQGGATFSQIMHLDQLFDIEAPDTYSVQVRRVRVKSDDKTLSNTLTFKILP